jgi:hypothetical protein
MDIANIEMTTQYIQDTWSFNIQCTKSNEVKLEWRLEYYNIKLTRIVTTKTHDALIQSHN